MKRKEPLLLIARERARSDLGLHPVHDTIGANIDGKGRCMAAKDFFELRLPAFACSQIIFVKPDLQALAHALRVRLRYAP